MLGATAQASDGPQPVARPAPLPAPQDVPYPGTLILKVDATDLAHKVFSVQESIPVKPDSDLILLYPQWETASHAPTVPLSSLAGVFIRAGNDALPWQRDPVNPYAFHLHVPPGIDTLDVALQYLSPTGGRGGAVAMSAAMVNVQWQAMLLYPAGYFVRDIPVRAALRLPQGFTALTSLDAGDAPGSFAVTSLERLVDSPVYAGLHTRRIPLVQGAQPVTLDLVADTEQALAIPDQILERYRSSVRAIIQLFGTPPFRHYEMIVSLSDVLPNDGGTEHLESGENNLPLDFYMHPEAHPSYQDLIWHELVHAWNGKSRVPQGLWTADFNTPAQDGLLWVYEGQTQYWGEVLAARLGHRSKQTFLDLLAMEAASAVYRPGRRWKSLADSSLDPLYDAGHHVSWPDWQRREDYYAEGPLFWLDIDARLRAASHGKHSLDDFARNFFKTTQGAISTYDESDVAHALQALGAADWAGILKKKLDAHDDTDLLGGLTANGYRLAWSEQPTAVFKASESDDGADNFLYSIGLSVDGQGRVKALAWNGPAFQAGFSPNSKLTAVDGQPFSLDALRTAIANSAHRPVSLSAHFDGGDHTLTLDYADGLRYPRLERIPGSKDGFDYLP
jgi:predicted metalloprotease with PDZ domain